ncbi:hypothetical protein F5Y16DRAFT_376775 [Xylariaceae sp. FL0255]|nr:hypothetical protein F5Y16DRAFT_376775 [Xylariaceae sp. FL0255]
MASAIPITCSVLDFDGVGLQDFYVTIDCSRRDDHTSARFESFTNSQGNILKWFRCAEPPTYLEPVNARDYERIYLTFSAALYFGHPRCPWLTVQVNLEPAAFEGNFVKLQFGPGNSTYSISTTPLLFQSIDPPGIQPDMPIALEPQCGCMRVATENHNRQAPDSVSPDYWRDIWSPFPEVPSLIRAPSVPPSELPLPTPVLLVSTPDIKSEPISPLLLPSPQAPAPGSLRITRAGARRLSPLLLPDTSCLSSGRVTRSRKRKATFDDELEPPKKKRRLQ